MNSRIEEGSEALKRRECWPSRISQEELDDIKLGIAIAEEFPVDSSNAFKRDSDEWIALEEALGECFFAVFHHYKPTSLEVETTAIFILSPFVVGQYQLWLLEDGIYIKVDQASEVRDDL